MNSYDRSTPEFVERMYRKAMRYYMMGAKDLAHGYMQTALHNSKLHNACRKKEYHIDTTRFERFEEL